ENIKFKCFKYISDNADANANEDWIENVSSGKKLFVKQMENLIVN
ncbi:MAG: 5'-methylthioadenosine nucleosidase, partial [Chloroflexi bacterium]|nr:5'-methylthioadenosine nucleosidase [Chloroflexota bacterium]